ncbi:MAG: acetyl-CoA carboxylase biotin carboxyl carrier protein [Alphaproteobacteria bacterium]|nr:acetyl-CoA carboxylase biotin carboxyl carrier protein [Alphaproteobacteria bacterium]
MAKKDISGSLVDPDYIESLAKIVVGNDLRELKISDGEMKVSIKRGNDVVMASAPMMQAMPTSSASTANSQSGQAQLAEPTPIATPSHSSNAVEVRAPMVGTAYMAPQPSAPNFVSEGAVVKIGDTLMIVEAMKVMNPIVAPCAGKIVKISVDNGQPVEFDEILMVIEP